MLPKYEEFTIENLIRLFQEEHDEKAFDQILKRYYHLIYGACLKFSSNKDDAKDLTLEVCTLIWEKLKLQEVHNFNSWMYSLCRNHCTDFYRSRKKERATVVQFDPEIMDNNAILSEPEDSEYEEEKDESLQKLYSLIAALPSDQRICMKMFYLKKLSYDRISSKTGYSLKKIKSALQSGRSNLRKAVNI